MLLTKYQKRHVLIVICLILSIIANPYLFSQDLRLIPEEAYKLSLDPSMISLEEGSAGDPGTLLDEQILAGDPAGGNGGDPKTAWEAWNGQANYAILDLKEKTSISAIYIYDLYSTGYFTVESGEAGNWTELFTDSLPYYQVWTGYQTEVSTRYLRLTYGINDGRISELIVYGTGATEDDSIAPAMINDLTAFSSTSYSVSLKWSATGDDDTLGTARSYDLRYSKSDISEANFQDADQAVTAAPQESGREEKITISGLQPSTNYYFAIKARDNVGNFSPISNITEFASGDPPAQTDVIEHFTGNTVATKNRYALGETIIFTNQTPGGSYEIYEDHKGTAVASGTVEKNGTVSFSAPYASIFILKVDGITTASIGAAPYEIQPKAFEPGEFDTFWSGLTDELATVPLVNSGPVPSQGTSTKLVLNIIDGKKVWGYIYIPYGSGPFPAIIELPAYGTGPVGNGGKDNYPNNSSIVVSISAFNEADCDATQNICAYGDDKGGNRDSFHYKWSVLGALKTIDYLFSLDEFDRANLFLTGKSQGGGLAIMTAGLDNRVKEIFSCVPAFGEYAAVLYNKPSGFNELVRRASDNGLDPQQVKIETGFYDIVNFAKRFNGKATLAIGYYDVVCPAYSCFAAFSAFPGEREIFNGLQEGHDFNKVRNWWNIRYDWYTDRLQHLEPPDTSTIITDTTIVIPDTTIVIPDTTTTDTSSVFIVPFELKEKLSLWPNPAGDILFWSLEELKEVNSADIYAMDGSRELSFIKPEELKGLEISSLQSGLYILKISLTDMSSRFVYFIKK